MSNPVEVYTAEAERIAADDSHGYDQTHRLGPDYDCSSLVAHCLNLAGYNVAVTSWTGNLRAQLVREGFMELNPSVPKMRGDILLNDVHHVAIATDTAHLVEAAYNEHGGITGGQTGDQTGREIRVVAYYDYPWNVLLRSPEAQSDYPWPEWTSRNGYLTTAEMRDNAARAWFVASRLGWTRLGLAAVLGNMQSESGINPGIWENLTVDYSRGYGLTQWTPATKYIDWAGAGWEGNGDKQMERIQYEADNGLQWFENPAANPVYPPITLNSLLTNTTLDVGTLANYFLWYYEHPYNPNQPDRATQAAAWLEFLNTLPTPGHTTLPIWLLFKFKGRG